MTPSIMLIVVQEHVVTAEGAAAKPEVAHPTQSSQPAAQRTHYSGTQRELIVGSIAEPAREARVRQATAVGYHRRAFLRVRTVFSKRKSYM